MVLGLLVVGRVTVTTREEGVMYEAKAKVCPTLHDLTLSGVKLSTATSSRMCICGRKGDLNLNQLISVNHSHSRSICFGLSIRLKYKLRAPDDFAVLVGSIFNRYLGESTASQ